jgi:hypothetical protein
MLGTDMEGVFEESVKYIEAFYDENKYRLGWRFLTCSKSVLEAALKIAFITLNPAGSNIPDGHSWASCENGSPYLYEVWGASRAGKSNLQIQIQHMFSKLCDKTNFNGSPKELIEGSLSGQFVPFRSPRLADLEHKQEAFLLGEKYGPIYLPK